MIGPSPLSSWMTDEEQKKAVFDNKGLPHFE